MSEEQVSTMARLYAERLMRGDTVSEAEMRVIIAGLMLSVDKLANAFDDMRNSLWSEEKMRKMIAEEVEKHCSENKRSCIAGEESDKVRAGFAAWCVRTIRAIFAG